MENYNNILYTPVPFEESIKIDNKQYYRYMDKLYIPEIPSALKLQDVISLSEIRIKKGNELINYPYTKDTILRLLSFICNTPNSNLLDFGSGNGILSAVIREHKINISSLTGVDACEYATVQTLYSYEKNLLKIDANDNFNIALQASIFDNEKNLSIESNSIDNIISSFVMHFKIYDSQLSELYRVLKPQGIFIYNDYVYDKYPAHAKKLIKKLISLNFILLEERNEFIFDMVSNTLKPQRFMIFTK